MSGFGAAFRKAREAKGISLDDVANETRIGVRFLRAIESEEFDILPGGLFNRGFIRAYAERLGLDGDQAVEDYHRLIRMETQETEAPAHRSRAHLPPWAIVAGVAFVIIAIVAYIVFSGSNESRNAPESPAEKAATPFPPPPAIPPPAAAEPAPQLAPEEKPAEPAPARAPLSVEVRVNEATWLQILTDGATADVGELTTGTTRNYTAQKSIEMKVGNAGGLSLKINDREISNIGKRGEVRQFTITPENAAQFGN